MFRDDYKACFDDIKGDKALLEKILEKSKEAPRKTKVIKFNKNIISAAAAVFVLAMAGFMYNMGMFDGFLPSDSNKTVVTEEIVDVENMKAIENVQEDSIKEEKTEEKSFTADVKKGVDVNENQAENVNEEISVSTTEEEPSADMSVRMMVLEPTEYKRLTVFKEGIEELTEKYDEAEKKYSYTDFEETKKVEITYYSEMPEFEDENTGGDILKYIGETQDGYIKITAYGISEEYMSEIIGSL